MSDKHAAIYLLSSDEPLLKKDKSDVLLKQARAQLPDAEYLIFTEQDFKAQGPQANLLRLENELRDPGLFGGDRILKLYFKDYDSTAAQVLDCLAHFYRPGVFVIVDLPRLNSSFLRLQPKPVPSKPNKRMDLKNAAIAYLKGLGASLEIMYPPEGPALTRFIAARCQQYGFTIRPEASTLLTSLNEGNLTAIDQALQLMALNAKQGAITLADLDTYFVEDSRFSAFEFSEALLSGQGARALNILRAVMSAAGGGAAAQLPLILSRLDTCLNVIVKLRGGLNAQQSSALLLSNGIVTPALKRACQQAAGSMPPVLLTFLISNLKECALLHSHFDLDGACALLQTMCAAVTNFGAMAYGAA